MHNAFLRHIGVLIFETIMFGLPAVIQVPNGVAEVMVAAGVFVGLVYVGILIGLEMATRPRRPERNISARNAIRYIVNGTFDGRFSPEAGKAIRALDAAADVFRERASAAWFKTWGRPQAGTGHYTEIPAEYWSHSQLEMTTLTDREEPLQTEPIAAHHHDGTTFTDIMVDKREIIKCWPAGWQRAIVPRLACLIFWRERGF